ncbi:MAG: translocation/assembly module TamB domain-containing protein [Woeseiaceae bacterium]|nr:translocation/assembly module TamB domain-containing protein [Woeseiaceae bacterium]
MRCASTSCGSQPAASTLRANGSWQDPEGIVFSLNLDALSDAVPGMSGRISASGRVRAGEPLPLIDVELVAEEAGWERWHVARLQLTNESRAGAPFDLAVQADELSRGDTRLDAVSVALRGSPAEHRLNASASGPDGQFDVALAGSASDWRDATEASWEGTLLKLGAERAGELSAALRGTVPLSVQATRASLGRACLDNAGGGSLCVEGNWTRDSGVFAAAELEALPLSLVRLASGTDLEFTQTLDGELRLAADEAGRMYGSGRIDVSPGTIRNPFDERLTLRTRQGFAEFNLATGRLLSGEIRLPFSDAAEIAGRFDVLDIGRGAESPVEGHLTANVRNIGVAARLVPLIDDAAGSFNADIRVAGRLAAPELSGGISLRDGLLAYDPLGIQLDELQMDGDFQGSRIELESTFRTGAGHGRLTSSAWYEEGGPAGLELALSGDDLVLVDLVDLGVTVDPDLRLALAGGEVRIDGRIAVPAARLSSVNLVDGGVSESPDVEYVGTEATPVEQAGNGGSGLDYSGNVEVVLGDNVVVDLDLAQARVAGRTAFSWHGPPMPRADGSFAVTGKFQAYGQLLEITEGVIRYPGIPADNPELRIRAEREIFGNSQVRRAGVLVSGTAARPQIDVYTTPATSEDRALTLLATGSDFNYEQGVGAVDVGTYIAPKLYASYGIGLFDNENVISVRYDLARNFGIKATSGRSAAGVDLSYTIQN